MYGWRSSGTTSLLELIVAPGVIAFIVVLVMGALVLLTPGPVRNTSGLSADRMAEPSSTDARGIDRRSTIGAEGGLDVRHHSVTETSVTSDVPIRLVSQLVSQIVKTLKLVPRRARLLLLAHVS